MSGFRSDLGEQIMNLVDNALNSDNYDRLSETISHQMNKLLGGEDRPKGSGGSYQTPPQGRPNRYGQSGPGTYYQQPYGRNQANRPGGAAQRNPYTQSPYQNRQNNAYSAAGAGRAAYEARRREMMAGQPHAVYGRSPQTAVKKGPVYFGTAQDEIPGKLLMIFGGIAAAGNALSLIGAIAGLFAGGGVGAVVGAAIATAVGGGLFLLGYGLNNRAKRFKKYVSVLSKKLYAPIKELSAEVGKSDDFVRRDLKKMIDKKWFREGHLDDKETTMIATNALYEQYRRTQEQADALRREQEEIEKQYGALSKDVRDVLEKGNEYVEKIREVNHALPEPDITEKLTKLENIISKIFARVKEEPGEAKNLSQFMDYYLPTTWKLVAAYREMEEQPVQGENILNAKKEIKESLDTINDAFETILDGMFREQAWDVSTDISVMKSMMKQDGLTGSDFKKPGVSAAKAQGNAAVMEEK